MGNTLDDVLVSPAHLTLMLLRYLKDESMFKMPGGIMLFSVSDIFRSLLPSAPHLTYEQPWVDFGELTLSACVCEVARGDGSQRTKP